MSSTNPATSTDHLDIGEAFRFVFRSKAWFGKMLLLDLFAVLSVVLIGLFVFYGYLIEISRAVRRGDRELPPWDHLGKKLHDGLLFSVALFIWAVPLLIMFYVSAATASCTSTESGPGTCTTNGWLAGLDGLLFIFLYVLIPPVWAQFLEGGFGATLNVAAVFRRAAFRPGLTLLVIVIFVVTILVAFAGLIALLIGVVVTYPYALFVQAHVYGQFARITDAAVMTRTAEAPSP